MVIKRNFLYKMVWSNRNVRNPNVRTVYSKRPKSGHVRISDRCPSSRSNFCSVLKVSEIWTFSFGFQTLSKWELFCCQTIFLCQKLERVRISETHCNPCCVLPVLSSVTRSASINWVKRFVSGPKQLSNLPFLKFSIIRDKVVRAIVFCCGMTLQ